MYIYIYMCVCVCDVFFLWVSVVWTKQIQHLHPSFELGDACCILLLATGIRVTPEMLVMFLKESMTNGI